MDQELRASFVCGTFVQEGDEVLVVSGCLISSFVCSLNAIFCMFFRSRSNLSFEFFFVCLFVSACACV